MPKTLGGVCFCIDAIKYDYNIVETVNCLKELCDSVAIIDAGSQDGTKELLEPLIDDKTTILFLERAVWDSYSGKEKLAFFQNFAKSLLKTDYYILCQADEIVHENSFQYIREAINTGEEGFYVTRYNLWKDANNLLNVPREKQPCNIEPIRIAKLQYMSVGDGESIEVPASWDYVDKIHIWHYGFVRKKEVMKDKIINMQEGIFQINRDEKLNDMQVFDWSAWFKETDLTPISGHPKFIKQWITNRP